MKTEKSYTQLHRDVINKLLELAETCAPTQLQLGYSDKGMVKQGMVLNHACPMVITELSKMEGVHMDLRPDGLHIW